MLVPYVYKAKITNVVDGDTVDAVIDVGFKLTTTLRLRLLGVDTAELTSKDPVERAKAQEAKLYLIQELLNKSVTIRTEKSDVFGRYLAAIDVDGRDFNNELLEKGLAVPFKG
jgi:micrococcal nuclease